MVKILIDPAKAGNTKRQIIKAWLSLHTTVIAYHSVKCGSGKCLISDELIHLLCSFNQLIYVELWLRYEPGDGILSVHQHFQSSQQKYIE